MGKIILDIAGMRCGAMEEPKNFKGNWKTKTIF